MPKWILLQKILYKNNYSTTCLYQLISFRVEINIGIWQKYSSSTIDSILQLILALNIGSVALNKVFLTSLIIFLPIFL